MAAVKTEDVKGRYTCRDEQGRPRLVPGMDSCDVIDALCRVEERSRGVLVIPTSTNAGLKCGGCAFFSYAGNWSGTCGNKKAREEDGIQAGEDKIVSYGRTGCRYWEGDE